MTEDNQLVEGNMFGRTVKIDDLEIEVSCTPSTPLWKVLELAAQKIRSWQQEPDYAAHGNSIAFRHGITVARPS